MNVMKTMNKNFIIIFLICLVIFFELGFSDNSEDIDWDKAGPVEIHQHMGELKAQALEKRRAAEKQFSQSYLISTQTNYDVLFYDLNLLINDSTQIIDGYVLFSVKATESSVDELQIDLHQDMIIDSVISPIYGDLGFSRTGDVVVLTLGQSYDTDEQFTFTIYYNGHPPTGGFQSFSFGSIGGVPVMASLSEPYFARTWWPCKDRMDDKPDSFNIAITVDTSLYVGSNGTLDSVIFDTGRFHTFYYRVRYPMTTYLFSVAISKYTVWYDEWRYNNDLDTMLLVHAVFPNLYKYSLPRYGIVPDILDILSDDFGLYPFTEEKYGHANFQWGGGMEHQTMTSMTGSSFGFSEPVVIHETAHQ